MSGVSLKQAKKKQQVSDKSGSKSPAWNIERILNTEINLFAKGFSDKNKEAFYLELSTLLTAGLDIKTSLELIESEQTNPKHAKLIVQLRDDLVNGASLWEAMKNSGEFTPYEYFSIQIGEETGKLDIVLSQLNGFYSAKLKQRRQFISALSYPIIILLTSIGAVTFMLLFIVPMFSDVYKRFGGELPYLTRIIISFSTGIRENFIWMVLILTAIIATIVLNRDKEWLKRMSAGLISKIPVVGRIVYAIQLARFCNSMSLLLGSKVPMIRSINLINQMITFYPIQITLDGIANGIMNGESLYVAMAKHPVFSKRLISLVKVGEEVNKLDVFFDKLSKQFQSDAEHQTSLLNTFLEPAMIIFLGTIVGFILLAMYLPMFELSTSIKG
jgi:type IV pilus assembly protein PilC